MTIADPEQLLDPPYSAHRGWTRLVAEAADHIWPWSPGLIHHNPLGFGLAVGILAVLVLAWVATLAGLLESRTMALLWALWSLVETEIRLRHKPYVKDGVWWGLTYRQAGRLDLLSYVGLKNILSALCMLAVMP
jgi:hypothetical protein